MAELLRLNRDFDRQQRRIAGAAPWLLSACEALLALVDTDPERYAGDDTPMRAVVEQARAAVAKAKGD